MALVFLTVVLPTPTISRDLQRDIRRQYVEQFLSQVETLQDLPDEIAFARRRPGSSKCSKCSTRTATANSMTRSVPQ